MKQRSRPERITIRDSLGKQKTLPGGESSFMTLGGGKNILFLGLGPSPRIAASNLSAHDGKVIYYLEHPDFAQNMPHSWNKEIPADWIQISVQDLSKTLSSGCQVLFYSFNLKLYPQFWNPIWAQTLQTLHGSKTNRQRSTTVWFPADETTLLTQELRNGFCSHGYTLVPIEPKPDERTLLTRLADDIPSLFLSLNFQGLDAYGTIHALLQQYHIPTAVWCVDNPLNLITKMKSRYWKDLHLLVTDAWFINILQDMGCTRIDHFPLATDPTLFCPQATQKMHAIDFTFVGRTSFPRSNAFFAGCTLPDDCFDEAKELLKQEIKPDFSWWLKALQINSYWPDTDIRCAGYASEQMGLLWKSSLLDYFNELGSLQVYGDKEWSNHLSRTIPIHPMVDYYGPLAGIYESSPYTLNLTGFLLPQGLTQRHFDVWAAGGFLLTDFHPGLSLFPNELVAPIAFKQTAAIRDILHTLEADPTVKKDLQSAWKEEICNKHTYTQRVAWLLDTMIG